MKINVQTYDLVSALGIVTRALPVRAVTQVMEGVLIEADGTTMTLTASDGRLTIRTCIPCMATEGGTTLLPGKLLAELAKKLPGSEVTIEQDGTVARVRSGRSRSSLTAMSANEYPEQIAFEGKQHYTIPKNRLRDMLTGVSFCMAADESRQILNGVLFDVTGGKLSTVALDGFRLAIATDDPAYADDISVVLPTRAVNELQRILANDDAPCELAFTDGKMSATFGGVTVTTVLLSGSYPDFHKILPQDFRTNALVSRSTMESAIDRASLMARDGSKNLIRLSVGGDAVNVSANSPAGDAEEDVAADINGPEIKIAFNSKYLTDVCKASGAEELTMSFNNPTGPCVIRPKDRNDRLYLVLPVRVM